MKFDTGHWHGSKRTTVVPFGPQLQITKIVHFKFQNRSFDLNVIGCQSEYSSFSYVEIIK